MIICGLCLDLRKVCLVYLLVMTVKILSFLVSVVHTVVVGIRFHVVLIEIENSCVPARGVQRVVIVSDPHEEHLF